MLAPEKTTETKRNPNAAEMDAGLSTYLDPCGDEEYRDKPKGSRKKSVDYLKLFPPREIHKKRIAFMLRSKKQLTKIVTQDTSNYSEQIEEDPGFYKRGPVPTSSEAWRQETRRLHVEKPPSYRSQQPTTMFAQARARPSQSLQGFQDEEEEDIEYSIASYAGSQADRELTQSIPVFEMEDPGDVVINESFLEAGGVDEQYEAIRYPGSRSYSPVPLGDDNFIDEDVSAKGQRIVNTSGLLNFGPSTNSQGSSTVGRSASQPSLDQSYETFPLQYSQRNWPASFCEEHVPDKKPKITLDRDPIKAVRLAQMRAQKRKT